MKKNYFLYILWGLFYFFLFSLLIENSFNYLDADLGWHIQVGKEIVTEKTVPRINHYNYTLEGTNWVDHEWLADALLYYIFNKY